MTSTIETTAPTAMAGALDGLLGAGFADGLAGLFERMEWAEEEIEAAQRRHPGARDRIWHSFGLLTPHHDLMSTEMVYRSHAAELLDRVAAGADTRPGTAAEVCCSCCDASQVAPLTTTAAGLYARMWGQAFPGHGEQWDTAREHYEALSGSQIDDLERYARHKLAQADRRLGVIECRGQHHGEPVTCTAGTTSPAGEADPLAADDPDGAAAAEAAGLLFAMA